MVSLEVRGEVGIINISTFGENSASKMMNVAAQVRSNQNIKKLVLDLRSNTGGLLDQSVLIASFFLPENSTFVKEVYKNDAKEEKTIAQSNSLENYPIVVVTDGSTASASEILAAALRDDRQVKLIGQKTYGKGVVQQVFTLRNGDLLKVTIAEWITPKGDKINLKGLEPDILVDLNKNSVDRAVEEILK
jgi:carboxyl-terminal processing protease